MFRRVCEKTLETCCTPGLRNSQLNRIVVTRPAIASRTSTLAPGEQPVGRYGQYTPGPSGTSSQNRRRICPTALLSTVESLNSPVLRLGYVQGLARASGDTTGAAKLAVTGLERTVAVGIEAFASAIEATLAAPFGDKRSITPEALDPAVAVVDRVKAITVAHSHLATELVLLAVTGLERAGAVRVRAAGAITQSAVTCPVIELETVCRKLFNRIVGATRINVGRLVDRDGARNEIPRRRATVGLPLADEVTVQVELLDTVIASVGNINEPITPDGQVRKFDELSVSTVQRACSVRIDATLDLQDEALTSPFHEKVAVRVELLNPAVAVVADINVTDLIDRDPGRLRELTVTELERAGTVRINAAVVVRKPAHRAPLAEKVSVGVELLDPVEAAVRNVNISGRIYRDTVGLGELAVTELERTVSVGVNAACLAHLIEFAAASPFAGRPVAGTRTVERLIQTGDEAKADQGIGC